MECFRWISGCGTRCAWVFPACNPIVRPHCSALKSTWVGLSRVLMWKLGMASPFPQYGARLGVSHLPTYGSQRQVLKFWQRVVVAGGEPKSTGCCCHKGMPGMQTVLRHQGKSFRLQLHQIFRSCSSGLVHVQAFYAVLWKRGFWRIPVT